MLAVPTHDSSNVENFNVSLASNSVGPGGVVSGQLTFRITAPKPFHRVSIKIVGKESATIYKEVVTSSEVDEGRSTTTTTPHTARSNVHKEHITVLGGIKGSTYSVNLPIGRYTFPFSFVLPSNSPPTVLPIARAASGGVDDGNDVCVDVGQLVWYVKAKLDTTPVRSEVVEDVAVFNVATAMPLSQYKTRGIVTSPPHHSHRSCCCCDQGTTTIQMALAQNMLVFGTDKTLDGCITIDNHQSRESTSNVLLSLSRMCWIKVGEYEAVTSQRLSGVTVVTGMKAGDGERSFNFSIPLRPDTKRGVTTNSNSSSSSGSTFRGRILNHYYQLTAVIDNEVIFKTPIVVSSGIDKSNSCPVIVTDRPGPIVPPKQYPQYVYAPPPGGQVAYPSGAAMLLTKQTRAVPQFEFVSPHHLST